MLNKASAVEIAADQARTLASLREGGCPIPDSILLEDPLREGNLTPDFDEIAAKLGAPFVAKLVNTSGGQGVFLIADVWALAQFARQSRGSRYLFQRFIAESAGRDIRVIVVGGECVVAIRRTSSTRSEWRANLSLGGTGQATSLTREQEELALYSASLVGLDFVGVDIVESSAGSLVLELNPKPGLQIEKITGVQLAPRVIHLARAQVVDRQA